MAVGVVAGVALAVAAYGLGIAPIANAESLRGLPTARVVKSARQTCEAAGVGQPPSWRLRVIPGHTALPVIDPSDSVGSDIARGALLRSGTDR